MFEIYQTSSDILYLILTIGIALVSIFLVVAIYHVIRILSNVRRVTERAKDTVDLINHYLWQPIKIMMSIMEKGKEYTKRKKNK